MQHLMLFRLRLLFCGLVLLCCMGLLVTYWLRKHQKFYIPKQNIPILLVDVLDARIQPSPGQSIFFLQTSSRLLLNSRFDETTINTIRPRKNNVGSLTGSEACAIESAALHNPNSTIFVLFARTYFVFNDAHSKVLNAVLSYPNVELRSLNLSYYSQGTPIEHWYQTKKLFRSGFVLSHISDFLRYLTLWRWGGTYLDLDVIVLRSLEELPPNYTGAESDNFLAAGVMNFSPDGIGRKVAEYCLKDFEVNFKGYDWGNNGPGVITRALKHICQAEKISEMFDQERCLGFKIFKSDAFYAIPLMEWEHFFDENQTQSTLNRVSQSYVAHTWNLHSKYHKHRIGAYGELAARNCPKVYASNNWNLLTSFSNP